MISGCTSASKGSRPCRRIGEDPLTAGTPEGILLEIQSLVERGHPRIAKQHTVRASIRRAGVGGQLHCALEHDLYGPSIDSIVRRGSASR